MVAPVKYLHSGLQGAPSLGVNWGDLVSLLDACLITGFNTKAIGQLTQVGGVATAVIPAGHNFEVGRIVEVGDVAQPAYNGQWKVLSTTSVNVTFAVPESTPATGTAVSQMTIRYAPLGWEKPYAAQYKGVYRSLNPASPKNMLKVNAGPKDPGYQNSTWAKWAAVGIIEADGLQDIDTIVGAQAPYDSANPTYNWEKVGTDQYGWYKWYWARDNAYESSGVGHPEGRDWVLIGDDQLFYLLTTIRGDLTHASRACYIFGDIKSFRPGDAYHTILSASVNTQSTTWHSDFPEWGFNSGGALTTNTPSALLLRNYTQVGGPTECWFPSTQFVHSDTISGWGTTAFPNGPDFSVALCPKFVAESTGGHTHIRGALPGNMYMPQLRPYPDKTVLANLTDFPDREVAIIWQQYAGGLACSAFDITGPWR